MPGACDMLKGSTVLKTLTPPYAHTLLQQQIGDDPSSTAFYHETDTSVA